MTRTRRILTLIGPTAAITVAGTLPASATSSEIGPVPTAIATGTVTVPASVAVDDWCQTVPTTTVDPLSGVSTTTYSCLYHSTISWTAGTTARGVTGYRVVAHLNNGTSVVIAATPAPTRTVSASIDQLHLQFQPRVSS
jgi:hypothetical protein